MLSKYIEKKTNYLNIKNANITNIIIKNNEHVGGSISDTKCEQEILDICELCYYGKDPLFDSVIISCSIFKLGSMYRDMSVYIDGLKKIIKYVSKKAKLFLRIYFDHSIEHDTTFKNLFDLVLQRHDNIQFCRYYCSSFIDNKTQDILHRGVFGMFIRFLPYFDKKLSNNLRFVTDIDFNKREILFYLKYVIRLFKNNKSRCAMIQKIGYEWKYANHFKNTFLDGTIFANLYIQKHYLSQKILIQTLIKLRNDDADIVHDIQNMIKDRIKLGSDANKFGNDINTFIYGIDEWFINKIFLPNILETVDSISVLYIADNISIYPKKMIDWKKTNYNSANNLFRYALGEKYIENDKWNKKNINLLSNLLNPYTIDDIESYNLFIDMINRLYVYISKHNDIALTDTNWISNLKKHVLGKYIVTFAILDKKICPYKLFKHIVTHMEFYHISTK